MKRSIVLASAAVVCSAIASAQESGQWTLQQCIDHALANNITLQKARLTKLSAEEDVKQSRAELLPSLNFSTNHSLGYRPWVDTGVSTVNNGTVATSVNKSYYNGSYSLSASWTVWNGNRNRNNLKLNKIASEQAELDSAQTANSIQEQIAQLYVQILYLNEAIEVSKQSLAASLKNEERGREMVEVGKQSRADLAQLTAQRAQDEYNVVEAETNLANYKLQLKQLLELTGVDNFDVYTPSASDDAALGDIPSLQEVYEAALLTRPEIEGGKLAIESSELDIKVARAGMMPSVSLSGGVTSSTTSMTDDAWGQQFKTNFNASVGVTLSMPIFDNRSTKTAVRKAKLQREQSLLDLKDQQKQLYSTIEGYWLDAQSNQQRFKAAQASVESEQASYDLLTEQFNLGLKNIVELLTGKSNLMNAKQEMLQSKYMTILDKQLLRFYKGESMEI